MSNLPPGVTEADIDRLYGDEPEVEDWEPDEYDRWEAHQYIDSVEDAW